MKQEVNINDLIEPDMTFTCRSPCCIMKQTPVTSCEKGLTLTVFLIITVYHSPLFVLFEDHSVIHVSAHKLIPSALNAKVLHRTLPLKIQQSQSVVKVITM